VSEEAKNPNEFRRYRQILTGSYLVVAASVVLLLTASVIKELFFRHSPMTASWSSASRVSASRISVDQPDPEELQKCHGLVLNLLTALGKETAELISAPQRGDHGELTSRRWEDFSRAWTDEWDVAEARCRFSELAGTKLGVAFDRLANVHGELPSMRLKYESLLVRFDEEQAAELARMRRALDLSQSAFASMARESAPAPVR
jgi:hypothetical protein